MAAAFAFGASVSPPDAVAATAILSRLSIPRRVVTVLEGESLVNDASGLVLYVFAVAAALALPLVLENGAPFPRRDLIIFLIAGKLNFHAINPHAHQPT